MTTEEQAYLYRHGIYEKKFAKRFYRIITDNINQLAKDLEDGLEPSQIDTKPLQLMYERMYLDIMITEGTLIWNSEVSPITGTKVKDIFDTVAEDLAPNDTAEMVPFWTTLMKGFLNTYIAKRIVEVGNTTIRKFNESVERFRNDGMTDKEIARVIKADRRARELRANTIARTEGTTAMNKAWVLALQSSKMKWEKSWNAIKDDRTRDAHFLTSPKEWIDISDNFIIGGFPMAYPGDSTQGSPVGQIINCRCMLRFRYAGERYGFRPKR